MELVWCCYAPVVEAHCSSKPTAETKAPKTSVAIHNIPLSLPPVIPLYILWDTFRMVIPGPRHPLEPQSLLHLAEDSRERNVEEWAAGVHRKL